MRISTKCHLRRHSLLVLLLLVSHPHQIHAAALGSPKQTLGNDTSVLATPDLTSQTQTGDLGHGLVGRADRSSAGDAGLRNDRRQIGPNWNHLPMPTLTKSSSAETTIASTAPPEPPGPRYSVVNVQDTTTSTAPKDISTESSTIQSDSTVLWTNLQSEIPTSSAQSQSSSTVLWTNIQSEGSTSSLQARSSFASTDTNTATALTSGTDVNRSKTSASSAVADIQTSLSDTQSTGPAASSSMPPSKSVLSSTKTLSNLGPTQSIAASETTSSSSSATNVASTGMNSAANAMNHTSSTTGQGENTAGNTSTNISMSSQKPWPSPSDSACAIQPIVHESLLVGYTIDVVVGAGNRSAPLLVDTGSSDLWIAATTCQSCFLSNQVDLGLTLPENCQQYTRQYGSGQVRGCIVNTTVTIGSYSLENHPVLVVSYAEGFEGKPMSGMLGLGMSEASITHAQNPISVMSDLGMISSPQVGIYLSTNGTGSQLVLGSPQSSPHADTKKTVVSPTVADNNGKYKVKLDGFVSQGAFIESEAGSILMNNIEVVLDTGTSDIRVPEELLLPIYAGIGGGVFYNDTTTGDLVVPCDGPNVRDQAFGLQFGGEQFYLPWKDLVARPSTVDSHFCYTVVQPLHQFLIGSAFLQSVYHVVSPSTGEVSLYGLASGQ
ncbi:hypothetical protein IAR55_004011 [Kwoniella newhampshirensis]|uniref:Peptidase A1 domain-containing protein n=1 Tax=Kwoniella newhampshirensis TaxID=1651941 RepID=A0AAW0YYN6_9TREE